MLLLILLLAPLVLVIPGYEFEGLFKTDKRQDDYFSHSSALGEGMLKNNPDVYQGVMYAKGVTSVAAHEDVDTVAFVDLDDMTDTFTINKEGKALVVFNAKWQPEADQEHWGMLCKILVDGVAATATERMSGVQGYTGVGESHFHVSFDDTVTGEESINTVAIVDLTEGEHTIKIQVKALTGNANIFNDRRMDILVWSAPVQE